MVPGRPLVFDSAPTSCRAETKSSYLSKQFLSIKQLLSIEQLCLVRNTKCLVRNKKCQSAFLVTYKFMEFVKKEIDFLHRCSTQVCRPHPSLLQYIELDSLYFDGSGYHHGIKKELEGVQQACRP